MQIKDLIVAVLIILIFYWYFNIRGINNCIMCNTECSDAKCIR